MEIIQVKNDGVLLAIIIRHTYQKPGISFFTPGDLSQQMAYMQHPAGHIIQPHVHNEVVREIHSTQEVLVIRRGRLRVDFYDEERNYIESRLLESGDLILLASGGHGFETLEDVEMFEIKQGPYAEEKDKSRFEGVKGTEIIIKGDEK